MPEKLTEGEVEEIIETYQDLGNMAKVADELGHSTSTVRKYVNEWEETQKYEEEEEVEEDDEAEIDFSHMLSNDSEVEHGVSFGDKSPGDFVSWYFEEDLDIVNVKSVDFLARRCDSKDAIPTEKKITNILQDLPSDLGNSTQIQWISEDYWSRARDYAAVKLGISTDEVRQRVIQQDADWVKVTANPNQPGQMQTENETSTVDFSEASNSRSQGGQESFANPGPNHSQNPNAQQQPMQPNLGQQSQQVDPQMQMMQQMIQEMREERKQMMQAMQQQNQQPQDDGDDSLTDKVREIAEMQQVLDSIGGEDEGNDEMVQALSHELSKIQSQIQQGNTQQVNSEDPLAGAFINLAEREDVDPETLTAVATNFGVDSDPEVKKKEMEKEIEMMKMQNRQELANDMLDGLGEIVENASSIGSLLAQGGQQGGQQTQQPVNDTQPTQGEEIEDHVEEGEQQDDSGFDLGAYAAEETEESNPEEEEIENMDFDDQESEEEVSEEPDEEEAEEEPEEETEEEDEVEPDVEDEDVQEEAEVA